MFPVQHHVVRSTQDPPKPKQHLSTSEILEIQSVLPDTVQAKDVPTEATIMQHAAKVIRSKNSGPFELTLDIMFDDARVYQRVKQADLLTNEVIRRLYHVSDEDIITNMYFDPALAWKCTLKRPWAQGSVGERDTLGTQQHAPLLSIKVPADTAHGVPVEPATVPVFGRIRDLSTKKSFISVTTTLETVAR